jgi:hypothetical protein
MSLWIYQSKPHYSINVKRVNQDWTSLEKKDSIRNCFSRKSNWAFVFISQSNQTQTISINCNRKNLLIFIVSEICLADERKTKHKENYNEKYSKNKHLAWYNCFSRIFILLPADSRSQADL